MRRIRLALGVAALVAGSVLTVASPAMAEDIIVAGSPDTGVDDSAGADSSTVLTVEDAAVAVASALPTDCIGESSPPAVYGCFHRYGDQIYVKDGDDNGRTAYVYWQLYLRTSSGSWKLRRAGRCFAQGVGHWVRCDYNFYEDTTLNAYGGYGSGVRVYPCETDSGCSPYYRWVRNNA